MLFEANNSVGFRRHKHPHRHRRTHFCKTPYKCPYPGCRKTFTRHYNLKHHQNCHTGTAEKAPAAALGTRLASNRGGRQRSDREQYPNKGSPISTPSPSERNLSASPNSELATINGMPCHLGEYQYMNSSTHLQGEYHFPPTVPTKVLFYYDGPLSIPEALANMEQCQPGSARGSPYISSDWQSASQNMPSPLQSNGYVYPDPGSYGSGAAMAPYY